MVFCGPPRPSKELPKAGQAKKPLKEAGRVWSVMSRALDSSAAEGMRQLRTQMSHGAKRKVQARMSKALS